MPDKHLTTLNTADDDFIIVRCKSCHKVLSEVTKEATGKLRQKCTNNKCKLMNKIDLPLSGNSHTILSGRSVRTT